MSIRDKKCDNSTMEEMIQTLRKIGLPADEIERIRSYYQSDVDGLRQYVLFMRALFDDTHEYI